MKPQTYGVLLTALEPLSHHDPTTGQGGNTLTFLRIPQVISLKFQDTPVWQHMLDRLCAQNRMPETIQELTDRLSLIEFIAVAYVRLLIDIYNSHDGTGLFAGMGRYEMLDRRLETSAVKAGTLHGLWDVLTTALQLGVHPAKYDEALATFWTLPPSVQHQVLAALAQDHRSIVSIARIWHTANKTQSETYAEKAQLTFTPESWFTPAYSIADLPEPPEMAILNVPAISGNSIRHQMVRYPGWLDLAERLDLYAGHAGEGELEQGVETLFDNGGNIKPGVTMPEAPEGARAQTLAMFVNGGYKTSGSSESGNAFALATQVRKTYPLLDLVGGVCNAFDLGESRLKVGAWLVCRENADALPAEIADTDAARISAFDYLTEITRTRQASLETENQGQMIYNYEALVKGVQVYAEFNLVPFTPELTRGALMSALDFYKRRLAFVGGQSARGHGLMDVQLLADADGAALDAYRTYLADNAEDLRAGLLDGSLGTGAPWVVK